MHQRAERAIRGTLLGTASVLLAAAGHAVAGGGVPGWLGVVVGIACASVVGSLVVGRRPSSARTAIVVVGAQGAFHYLFSGLGGSGVDLAAAHVHGPGSFHSAAHAGHSETGMLAAHLIAAALTLLLLRRAEAAVWRMLRRVLARVLAPASAPIPVPTAVERPVASAPARSPRRGAHPPQPLRGPPALSPA